MSDHEKLIIRDDRSAYQRNAELGWDNYLRTVTSLPGILLAAMVYPVFVGLVFFVLLLLGLPAGGTSFDQFFSVLISVFLFTIIGSLLGGVVSLFTGMFSIAAFAMFNWTIGNYFSTRGLVAISGGLAGYVPISTLLIVSLTFDRPGPIATSVLLTLFLLWAAVLFGTVGATWFYTNHSAYRNKKKKFDDPKFQFRIVQLMLVTLWCGLILGLSPLMSHFLGTIDSRVAGFEFPLLICIWIVMQTSCVWLQEYGSRFRTTRARRRNTKSPS